MSTVRFLDVLNVQESGKTRKSFVLNPSLRWQTVDLPSRMGEEAISGNGHLKWWSPFLVLMHHCG